MHSPLSLAVGYKEVVTYGRRSCNSVVAILAKDKTTSLCSRCEAPVLRGVSLSVTMPGGGTRPGEEVRDGPHNNNRCGCNRCGVAPTAASLRPRDGLGLSGSGLYTAVGRAGTHRTARPFALLLPWGVAWNRRWLDHVYLCGGGHNTAYTHVSQGYLCSALRLLSWVGASSLLGAGPSLCADAMPL